MATPGLSFTQSADAPSAADTDNVQNIGGAGALVKTTGKGISPVGNIAMDATQTAELLANMQQMVDDRTGAGSQFMRGLERAAAWGSGGVQGPIQALATINAQHQREDESVSNMRQQMAAYRSAAAQNENIGKSLDTLTAGGGGQGGVGGSTFGTISPLVMGEVQRLKNLGRNAEAEKYYQNAVLEANKQYSSAEWAKPIETNVGENIEHVPLSQYARGKAGAQNIGASGLTSDPVLQTFATVESGGKNIPSANTKSTAYGIYQINNPTFDTAKTLNPALKDVTWEQFKANPEIQTKVAETIKQSNAKKLQDAGLPNSLLNQYTTWFSGNTKLAAAPAETPIASIMSKEQIDANPSLAGKTAGQVRATMEAALNQAIPSAAAQTAPKNVSLAEARANADYLKENAKANAEAQKKEIEKFKDATSTDTVSNQIMLSRRLGELTEKYKDNQKVVGMLNDKGVGNAVATLISEGLTTPVGQISFKGLEDALQKVSGAGPEEIKARQEIRQILKSYALEASKVASGQGAMSDFERQMFEQIAGSTSNSMDMLRRVQRVMQARADFNDRIGRAYEDSYTAGKPQDFQAFKKSAEYRTLVQQHRDTLLGITKDLEANPSGPQPKSQTIPTTGTTSGGIPWKIVK
jgi:hypothetical protein